MLTCVPRWSCDDHGVLGAADRFVDDVTVLQPGPLHQHRGVSVSIVSLEGDVVGRWRLQVRRCDTWQRCPDEVY